MGIAMWVGCTLWLFSKYAYNASTRNFSIYAFLFIMNFRTQVAAAVRRHAYDAAAYDGAGAALYDWRTTGG